MLEIEVWKTRGKCPVFKKGDKTIIDHPKIVLEKTDVPESHIPGKELLSLDVGE